MNDRGASVLEQYELEVRQINRGRGALLCDTDKGLKLLKEYKGSGRKAEMLLQVLEHVQQHFSYIDQYAVNKQGGVVTQDRDGRNYIVKDWFEGRECDVRDTDEVCKAVSGLALLHQSFQMPPEECEYRFRQENMEQELVRHNRELRKIRRFIRENGKDTKFETYVINHYPYFYEQAEAVTQELLQSDVHELQLEAEEKGYLCHGDYNQHQVLFLKKGIAITNFDKCHVGIQVKDLCQFMRKVLEKNNWNVTMGKRMIDAYSSVLPLSKPSHAYILYRLSYPEKFWKLCNQYYNSNKAWVPEKMIHKLETLVSQEDAKCRFIESLREDA